MGKPEPWVDKIGTAYATPGKVDPSVEDSSANPKVS